MTNGISSIFLTHEGMFATIRYGMANGFFLDISQTDKDEAEVWVTRDAELRRAAYVENIRWDNSIPVADAVHWDKVQESIDDHLTRANEKFWVKDGGVEREYV